MLLGYVKSFEKRNGLPPPSSTSEDKYFDAESEKSVVQADEEVFQAKSDEDRSKKQTNGEQQQGEEEEKKDKAGPEGAKEQAEPGKLDPREEEVLLRKEQWILEQFAVENYECTGKQKSSTCSLCRLLLFQTTIITLVRTLCKT